MPSMLLDKPLLASLAESRLEEKALTPSENPN
jgi:hypothetical protein